MMFYCCYESKIGGSRLVRFVKRIVSLRVNKIVPLTRIILFFLTVQSGSSNIPKLSFSMKDVGKVFWPTVCNCHFVHTFAHSTVCKIL